MNDAYDTARELARIVLVKNDAFRAAVAAHGNIGSGLVGHPAFPAFVEVNEAIDALLAFSLANIPTDDWSEEARVAVSRMFDGVDDSAMCWESDARMVGIVFLFALMRELLRTHRVAFASERVKHFDRFANLVFRP